MISACRPLPPVPSAAPSTGRAVPRPFLKWVGGKTQLLPVLRPFLPATFGRYFEPFLGGAALFFDQKPAAACLTDVNEELIHAYTQVRDDVEGVIRALGKFKYDKEVYYAVRAMNPRRMTPSRRAARTIFLNRTGFNGLYRVNSRGGFNVPFGRYENPLICDAENLRACAAVLAGHTLAVRPFEAVLDDARAGDFVYFDPPYLPVSRTADFTAYAVGGFGLTHHERLASVVRELIAHDVRVLLSNADVPEARRLYRGLDLRTVAASRRVSATNVGRGGVTEVLVSG
jgi:DNA adenine methylase